ncbi:MAG TPA: nuclear transport factor 2 family protein [Albitalea sp.]|uniref:YybH family protein n=1 Tax=Piscinibacter sp. TaxID=1903157 RepID=UPI002ECFADFC
MRIALSCLALCSTLLAGCAATAPPVDRAALERQVADTERAFAKTMADRDLDAFSRFLSEETVFFSGPTPLRGKAAVTAFWKRFYEKPAAPFSWRPERVEALDSGTLALSTGPVFDPAGKCIGRFTSIWRQESPGTWRIIFDRGGPCDE